MTLHRSFALVLSYTLLTVSLSNAQTISTFTPEVLPPFLPSGSWGNSDDWDTTNFPDNGQPGAADTYDAIVDFGAVFLGAGNSFTVEALTIGVDSNNDAGTISGNGNTPTLNVNGRTDWTAGGFQGRLVANLNGGADLTGPETKIIGSSTGSEIFSPVVNHTGTGSWTDGDIGGQVVSGLTSLAQFNHLGGGTFTATAGGHEFRQRFNNSGDFVADPGAGQTIEFRFFFNDGEVAVRSGTLDLTDFSPQFDRTSSGSFTIDAGADVRFIAHDLTATSSVTGAGDVTTENFGPTSFGGVYAITGVTTVEGSTDFPLDATTGGLILDGSDASPQTSGGFNSGSGTRLTGILTVAGQQAQWIDGSYRGTATINAPHGIAMSATDDEHALFEDVTLNLGGGSTLSSVSLFVEDASTVNILPGATLAVSDNVGFQTTEGGVRGVVTNDGTITATPGMTYAVELINNGLIVIGDGNFSRTSIGDRDGVFSQAADGELRLADSGITGLQDSVGGSITGSGDFNFVGQLGSAGVTLSPGLDPSEGSPIGSFEFNAVDLVGDATSVFDLGGSDDGLFDTFFNEVDPFFANPGDITLGGSLELRFALGYESAVDPADTFAIITATDAIDGAFANVAAGQRIITSDGLGSFIVNYGATSPFGANAVVLSDYAPIAIPEPVSAMLLLTAVGLLRAVGRSGVIASR